MPNKVFEVLAVGRPIVTGRHRSHAQRVHRQRKIGDGPTRAIPKRSPPRSAACSPIGDTREKISAAGHRTVLSRGVRRRAAQSGSGLGAALRRGRTRCDRIAAMIPSVTTDTSRWYTLVATSTDCGELAAQDEHEHRLAHTEARRHRYREETNRPRRGVRRHDEPRFGRPCRSCRATRRSAPLVAARVTSSPPTRAGSCAAAGTSDAECLADARNLVQRPHHPAPVEQRRATRSRRRRTGCGATPRRRSTRSRGTIAHVHPAIACVSGEHGESRRAPRVSGTPARLGQSDLAARLPHATRDVLRRAATRS